MTKITINDPLLKIRQLEDGSVELSRDEPYACSVCRLTIVEGDKYTINILTGWVVCFREHDLPMKITTIKKSGEPQPEHGTVIQIGDLKCPDPNDPKCDCKDCKKVMEEYPEEFK